MIFVGCCGFPISQKRYYLEYSVVEIQQTFYQIPSRDTLAKWRKDAPETFEFIVKAWQGITHPIKSPTWRRYRGALYGEPNNYGNLRYTEEVIKAWRDTTDAMNVLRCNKVVVQLPPSLEWAEGNKDEIKTTLEYFAKSGHYIILEPRHESWKKEEVKRVLHDLGIVHCVDPFKDVTFDTGKFNYFRLHGIDGYNYAYRYSDEDLLRLSKLVLDYLRQKDVYVMFNNKYMYEDSRRFMKIMEATDR